VLYPRSTPSTKPTIGRPSDDSLQNLDHIVGIVEQEALTGRHPTHRDRQLEPTADYDAMSVLVYRPRLPVLVLAGDLVFDEDRLRFPVTGAAGAGTAGASGMGAGCMGRTGG
jgi:hypothetical protein